MGRRCSKSIKECVIAAVLSAWQLFDSLRTNVSPKNQQVFICQSTVPAIFYPLQSLILLCVKNTTLSPRFALFYPLLCLISTCPRLTSSININLDVCDAKGPTFSMRAVGYWNRLLDSSNTVSVLKSKFETRWHTNFPNHLSVLTHVAGSSSCTYSLRWFQRRSFHLFID